MSHTDFAHKKKLLVVDDDESVRISIKHSLKNRFEVYGAKNADEMNQFLQGYSFLMALVDMNISAENEGLQLIARIKEISADTDIIIISSNTDKNILKTAMSRGASAWLVKDFSIDQLEMTIDAVLFKRELLKENQHFEKARNRDLSRSPILGISAAAQKIISTINRIKKSNANVLIFGETGTGKELVARHIGAHEGKPFVAVDSATITSSMAESILFGHEKGAFTGALESAKGLFEEADGGVIYFDEIGNMPLDIQAKLLRVIQEKEIMRVGSRKPIQLDFRVIAATNRNLEEMCTKGLFKYDLFQRLNVIPVQLTPLRERKEDLDLLVAHFFKKHALQQRILSLSDDAKHAFQNYHWPGNIRELSNTIAYLCTMYSDQSTIEIEDLPEAIRQYRIQPQKHPKDNQSLHVEMLDPPEQIIMNLSNILIEKIEKTGQADFYSYIRNIETAILKALFSKYSENLSQLSRCIKMSRSHLYAKLNSIGLKNGQS